MFFYLFIGVLTAVLAQISVNNFDKNKLQFYITFACFILVPSIIEGCRDWNIGQDMYGYGSAYFYDALRYSNVFSFLNNIDTKEYAYHLLCYFCGKVGPINLYMFAAALIKMTMIGLTCLHFRKNTIVWLAVLGYMLIFYWYGFSLMRQSLALSICMYSVTYLFDRRYVGFLICIVVAYLFHNSSIFMLFLPAVMYMARMKHRILWTIGGVVVIYGLATVLFVFIATSGLFGESKMDLYMDSGVTSAKSNILIMVVYALLPFFCKIQNKTMVYYIRACSLIGLMFLMLSSLFEVAFRVSFYQMMPLLFLVPALLKQTTKQDRRTLGCLVLVMLYLLHIVVAAKHGMADTIPYKSIILDSII